MNFFMNTNTVPTNVPTDLSRDKRIYYRSSVLSLQISMNAKMEWTTVVCIPLAAIQMVPITVCVTMVSLEMASYVLVSQTIGSISTIII